MLFIGLDGAEPDLIDTWMAQGRLPTLKSLAAHGSSCRVSTLPAMGDGAVWPTLITGVNPGRHGRYFRIQLAPGSYSRRTFDVDDDLAFSPFWLTLSGAGQRVAVLDVPYAPASRGLNGVLVTDWLIHDRYGRPRGWPEGFAADVLGRYGDDPLLGNSDRVPDDSSGSAWLLERSLERVGMKESLVVEVVQREAWDVVVTTFTEPHDVGHRMWHLHDPAHPRHDAEWLANRGDPLLATYERIDAAIGRMVAASPPDTVVVLFTGLGMGPNYTANRVLDRILRGFEGVPDPGSLRVRARNAGAPQRIVRIAGRIDEMRRTRADARARFFVLPHNANAGAVRINLAGREPNGVVAPHEFDAVCNELADKLQQLVNPCNGAPIVSEVVRTAHSCLGPRSAEFPDLFVVWNREQPFDSVSSPDLGTIGGADPWGRTGDHTPHATFTIGGPGAAGIDIERTMSVVDVAPTVAALRNVRLPDVDGRSVLLRSRVRVID